MVQMTKTIEDEFHQAMLGIDDAAAKHGYHPTYFLRMIHELGGLAAAKRLLSSSQHQSGLTRLWELDLLENSMEALVLEKRWQGLFSDDELREARRRLTEYGYQFSR